jgi:hypothetical protein
MQIRRRGRDHPAPPAPRFVAYGDSFEFGSATTMPALRIA